MTENTINTVRVKKVIDECRDVKTLVIDMRSELMENYILPKPGQFVMVWVPGVDEVPMSLSNCDNNGNWEITVKNVGECTNALLNLNVGDYIGIRGPLGNHFKIPSNDSKEIFLIGGGIGIAPLRFLSKVISERRLKHIIIEGAKIDTDLMYINSFQASKKNSFKVHYCTDDGSYGIKGVASDIFKEKIEEKYKGDRSNIILYSCGPEQMLYKLFQTCQKNNIEFYASLERIMRCGCGLCGLCALDPLGLLVCKDGPIFDKNSLNQIEDFGKYKRDFTGKKVKI
ncbi:MAG: dihydroorotate dehydrogenase electron transfer subunit [Promethearchaeota archaeon]